MQALYAFPSPAAASCLICRSRASLALRVYLTLSTSDGSSNRICSLPASFLVLSKLALTASGLSSCSRGPGWECYLSQCVRRPSCLPAEPASRPPLSFTSTRSSGRYAVSRRRSVARSTPMQVIFSLFEEERCISRLKSQDASRTGGAQTHEEGTIVRVCQY